MSETKKAQTYKTIIEGLQSANRGNPFWTKADAMQTINLYRRNQA